MTDAEGGVPVDFALSLHRLAKNKTKKKQDAATGCNANGLQGTIKRSEKGKIYYREKANKKLQQATILLLC